MSESLDDARRALRHDEPGEALVHLWNAFEVARSGDDDRELDDIADLARKAASQGDEGEKADAKRLLAELGVEPDEATDDGEQWVDIGGEPTSSEPSAEPAEAEPEARRGKPTLAGMLVRIAIPLAVFLWFWFGDRFT